MLDGIFEEDEIPLKELTMSQFIYGELCIWQRPRSSKLEWKAREVLLQRVVKNEPMLGFQKAKEIYKQFISKIEKGNISWKNKNEIDRIETNVVLRCVSIQDKQAFTKKSDSKNNLELAWCKEFNKGNCSLPDQHEQLFQGESVKIPHICQKCFLRKKERNKHKATDACCPLKGWLNKDYLQDNIRQDVLLCNKLNQMGTHNFCSL